MIEIKSIGGRVLYVAENAQDVRAALREAVSKGADLQGADLRGADLRGAYLQGAYLRGADLQGADLRGADLRGADLQGADLRGAYLRGAYLRGAYLRGAYLRGADLRGADLQGADLQGADLRGADEPGHPFYAIRLDFWDVLDHAPTEVPALRASILAGNIDGSTYSGSCACLVGTIAQACEISGDDDAAIREKFGIVRDASRPAEQWFAPIRPGDEPVDVDKLADASSSEGIYRMTLALAWLDQWTESRQRIGIAMASMQPQPGDTSA